MPLSPIRSASFLIAAHARNRVIGLEGGIPWHAPHDLRFFARQTRGTAMIMGRGTWDSLPGLLPGRASIVVTSRPLDHPGAIRASSFEEALSIAETIQIDREAIAFIGGASIYRQALDLPWLTKAFITEVDVDVAGDTFLPVLSPADGWSLQSKSEPTAEEPVCRFAIYERSTSADLL